MIAKRIRAWAASAIAWWRGLTPEQRRRFEKNARRLSAKVLKK